MPKCTYCSANVSPNAKTCPNCGDNLEGMREQEGSGLWKIGATVSMFAIGAFVFSIGGWYILLGLGFIAYGVLLFYVNFFADNDF